MANSIEKALSKLAEQKNFLSVLYTAKRNITSRSESKDKDVFAHNSQLIAFDKCGNNVTAIKGHLLNLLITPEVVLPQIEAMIEKLEKSNGDIERVMEVLETAIKPVLGE